MTSSPSIDTRVPVADPYAHSRAVSLLRSRLRTGAPLRLACLDIDSTLTGDPGPLTPLVFSPDGRTLATGNLGPKITLWSLPARYAPPK